MTPHPHITRPGEAAPLRRYLAFAGEAHEASGGWNDFVCSADDVDTAMRHVRQVHAEIQVQLDHIQRAQGTPVSTALVWHNVVDSETGTVVSDNDSDPWVRP